MNVETRDPLIRRKLAPRRPELDASNDSLVPQGPAGSIVRSFSRAITRAAPLIAERGRPSWSKVSQAELLDQIDPAAFVGLLCAPDSPPGLAIMSATGFSAIIEAMTIGVFATHTQTPRRPTATDSSLLSEVLNAALSGLGADDIASSYTVDRPVPDHRLLPVLLDDVRFDIVSLQITLVSGETERELELQLCFPVCAGQHPSEGGQAETAQTSDPWEAALEASVLAAQVRLRAELGRVTMPLAQVMELGTGAQVMLPLSNLEDVRLVALDGQEHAVGRLGQTRGMRAMRVISTHGTPAAMAEMTPAHPTYSADTGAETEPSVSNGTAQPPNQDPAISIPGAAILPAAAK